ncbi:MAG: hypothetical protein ACFFDT_24335, partial [Candidatus Hodarchaeota archaeon]
WNQHYGGTKEEHQGFITQTIDGGFAIAGTTRSFGLGPTDMWLVKIDTNGTLEWSETYGGKRSEALYAFIETSDNGFALVGTTGSFGESDVLFVKTDVNGTAEWYQGFGRNETNYGVSSLLQTRSGEFCLVGYTTAFGAGSSDMWLTILGTVKDVISSEAPSTFQSMFPNDTRTRTAPARSIFSSSYTETDPQFPSSGFSYLSVLLMICLLIFKKSYKSRFS